jgi:serine protease
MTHPFKALLFYAASAAAAIAQPVDPETGAVQLNQLAEQARAKAAQMSFEEFRAQVPFVEETGKFYVNGDTPVRNEKLLREFWEQSIRTAPTDCGEEVCEFAVITVGGLDQIWSQAERHALSYCVSAAFGSRHPSVVADMAAATAAWEAVADLDFVYMPTEDSECNTQNTRVLFDVRPVNAGGRFLAAAFFPNDPRADRSVVIDPSSFQLDPNGNLTLRGILRHELGHAIGGRHEHTRPEAGTCFEDPDWRGVTDYDAFSVMHYPQCNGQGDWTLSLTARDQNGIACLYGAAAGFQIDTSVCTPKDGKAPVTQTFGPMDIAADELIQIGEFPVAPGSRFRAVMTGDGDAAGDPDLYVKLDAPVSQASYDCRPYSSGPEEECNFDVPADKSTALVAVHGYAAGSYSLTVTSVDP